jgi:hypothetical protein
MYTDAPPFITSRDRPVGPPTFPKTEWIRRFAYRAMLLEPSIDTVSAKLIADSQFEDACDLQPEDAAEIYSANSGH